MSAGRPSDHAWWHDWRYLTLLVLLGAVPLLWPPLPPLIDAPGHLSRYHIQTTIDHSQALQRYFSFDWKLIGNLGVDLLIVPLSALIGLEPALKLIVLMIPVLTALGLVLVSKATHRRVTPFVAFALPLAYAFPFQFGFLNSCLSTALALLAFAGWISLASTGHAKLRSAVFVPVGLLLWLCHVVGWAELGLMVAAHEWSRSLSRGDRWWQAVLRAVRETAPLWPPIALMLFWRSGGAAGDTTGWFVLANKLTWLTDVFRERWKVFDLGSMLLVTAVVVVGLALRRRIGFAKDLGWVILALTAAYLVVPYTLLGSDFADMRLMPLLLAVALLALREPPHPRLAGAVATIGLLFFLARTVVITVDFAGYARGYRNQLVALDYIPRGSRVLVVAAWPCRNEWASGRTEHLGGMAIVRRDAFTNDQWALSGAQLLSVHYPAAGFYQRDPSQFIPPWLCKGLDAPVGAQSFPKFPTSAFDYVWLISLQGADRFQRPDLIKTWSRSDGALYQVLKVDVSASSPT